MSRRPERAANPRRISILDCIKELISIFAGTIRYFCIPETLPDAAKIGLRCASALTPHFPLCGYGFLSSQRKSHVSRTFWEFAGRHSMSLENSSPWSASRGEIMHRGWSGFFTEGHAFVFIRRMPRGAAPRTVEMCTRSKRVVECGVTQHEYDSPGRVGRHDERRR